MTVIGIAGRAGVGKTTAANAIAASLERQGRTVRILPFAAPLKRIAFSLGWDGKKDARGRRLLEVLGTDAGREYDPDLWVRLWRDAAEGELSSGVVVIADDVRFANETDAVRARQGLVVRLVRSRGWLADSLAWIGRRFAHPSNRDRVRADRTYVVRDGDIVRINEIAAELAEEML